MNGDTFFARLHEQLDARRDPLDDPELVAFVAEHPEHLAELAGLRADLRVLAASPRRTPVRRPRWPWLAAAAAATCAGAAFAAWPCERSPACTPRIIAASLEEAAPRAHVAASYCVRQSLLATANTSFETFEQRSEPRW